MNILQILLLGATFLIVFSATLVAMKLMRPSTVQRRLEQMHQTDSTVAGQADAGDEWLTKLEKVASPFAKLSVPKEDWDKSALRIRFMNAGWRNERAMAVYFGTKTVLSVAFPIVFFLFANPRFDESHRLLFAFLLLVASAIGFYLPNAILERRAKRRMQEIFESFPDALDLITVCIEAGLGLDAAILKVVDEMRFSHPALTDEFHLFVLEVRAGLSREKALRNLAARTGVEDIDMLVAMLIQADRFGTSIGDAMRVHADTLRTKRRMLAEERAAKIALKLLFPLIFFIFPSLMVVLLGPAVIQLGTLFHDMAK